MRENSPQVPQPHEGASRAHHLTDRVAAWKAGGTYETVGGHRIFVRRSGGDGPLVVLLHGFPTSSYDWRGGRPRPRGHRRCGPRVRLPRLRPVRQAHRHPLLPEGAGGHRRAARGAPAGAGRRARHGRLRRGGADGARPRRGPHVRRWTAVLLTNSSVIIGKAHLTAVQKLLRGPPRPARRQAGLGTHVHEAARRRLLPRPPPHRAGSRRPVVAVDLQRAGTRSSTGSATSTANASSGPTGGKARSATGAAASTSAGAAWTASAANPSSEPWSPCTPPRR